MPNYEIQISSNVKVELTSDFGMARSEESTTAIMSLLQSIVSSTNYADTMFAIAGKWHRIRYQVTVSRIINRSIIYNDAIQYIRTRKGVDFDPQLADYAIQKLLEVLRDDP